MDLKGWRRNDLIYLVIVCVFTLTIQSFFISPPIMSDDMEYFYWATKFPHMPEIPNHWSLRIGLILPVAILYRIFGQAEIVYYTVPFASMVLLSCGTYWLGSRLFNRRIGLISALFMIMIPNLLTESSLLLPDIPATACVVAGFGILASLPGKLEEEKPNKPTNTLFLYFLAGAFFGWAYLVKEYYIFFSFLIPLAFAMFKLTWKRIIPVIVGMAAVFSIEAVLNLLLYSNPLIRLGTAAPRETIGYIERDVWRIISYFPTVVRQRGGQGPLILSGIGFIYMVAGIIIKNKKLIFLAGWVLIIYVVFTTAGLLPVLNSWEGETLLRVHKFRYWIPILPPLFIAGVAGFELVISRLVDKMKIGGNVGKKITSASLSLLFISSSVFVLLGVWDFPNLTRNGADHFLELRRFLQTDAAQGKLIWINRDIKVSFERIFPMYSHNFWGKPIWSGQIKYLNTNAQYLREDEIKEGWVLINRYFFNPDFQPIPDYLVDPPPDWKLVFESDNAVIAIYAAN